MDKSIFEILKLLGGMNQNPQPFQNETNSSRPNIPIYPNEAYSQPSQTENNNFLPLIMSLLNKNNSLSEVFSLSKPTEKETSSPSDEILL